MQGNENIQAWITDALIERQLPFMVDGVRYYIYPTTLGKSFMLSKLIQRLEINEQILAVKPEIETLRLASTHTEDVAYIIAYSVCRTKRQLFDYDYIQKLVSVFRGISTEERAHLLWLILDNNHTQDIIKHYGIDKELEWMRKAEAIKDDSTSVSFCAKSIWGNMIDWACERYKWTVDYVLWGVSQTTLELLQADYLKTMYLSEDEYKKLRKPSKRDKVVDMNTLTPEQFVALMNNN